MQRRVFVTGATGFLGRAVLGVLLRHGHRVDALARPSMLGGLPLHERLQAVAGDIRRPGRWQQSVAKADVVLHLAGIIKESPRAGVTYDAVHRRGTEHVLAAMQEGGRARMVYMSSLGSALDADSPYHRSKALAEEAVQASGLEHVILRPSAVYGPGDRTIGFLIQLVRNLPAVPVPGHGQYSLQPVALPNVVEGLAKAVTLPHFPRTTYEIGGPRAYTLAQLLDAIGGAVGRAEVRIWSLPEEQVRSVVERLQRFRWFPLSASLLTALFEGNTCNPVDYFRDFCIRPIRFEEGVRAYLARTRGIPAQVGS